MHVGIPKEVKNNEYRVAITPSGVHELVRHGHEVHIETGAGAGSSITDDEYVAAGAKILDHPADVWAIGDLILKVKEPIASEYELMREGQTLFTYLHLAANEPLTRELVKRKVTGIAYETVELPDHSLPLLAPMSAVAGRLAPQVGAATLMDCVANMPGAVPHTSTYALTNVTLPYAVELADLGWRKALQADAALARGLNTQDGRIVYGPVAAAWGSEHVALADVLS